GTRGGDGEIAGAAAGVEHRVPGTDDRPGGDPAPAQVEPGRHHPVHHVVDRGDAVEHRLHLARRERSGRAGAFGATTSPRTKAGSCAAAFVLGFVSHWPHRRTSVFSRPSRSSARPAMKSTRSATDSAPW